MSDTTQNQLPPSSIPPVRTVGSEQPWVWLNKGWDDFRRSSGFGFLFGATYAVAGVLVLALLLVLKWPWLAFPAVGGFLMLGPLTAVGLYEISRRLQTGEPLTAPAIFTAFRRNISQLALMGLLLAILFIFWLKVAGLIFGLFFGLRPLNPETFFSVLFRDWSVVPFFIIGNAAGAILAFVAFSISAVSVPMLMDRRCDVLTAVITSLRCVSQNTGTMLIWGLIIAGLLAISVVTLFIGLVVALPVIGHASWHAYQDLVDVPAQNAAPEAASEKAEALPAGQPSQA